MTRILLALLAFYRRWLSPLVHRWARADAATCPHARNMR